MDTAKPQPRRFHAETFEDWADDILSTVFRITIDSNRKVDRNNHTLSFLPDLAQEVKDRGDPPKLSIDLLDQAILEICGTWNAQKPLMDYLLPSWKAVVKAGRQLRDHQPEKVALLQEAKRLCMSNCIFALTLPEYFG
jgi:ubiquitin conjugation factor E4 B